ADITPAPTAKVTATAANHLVISNFLRIAGIQVACPQTSGGWMTEQAHIGARWRCDLLRV
ncbi:MAG: hypothetical protein WBV82_04500, partial [Myxococcaceae bacterium]